MPADHGLRPDDLQSVQHAGRQPIQPGKYQTVDAGEGQSLRRFTRQHVELMTKRQDLYLQRRSRSEQSDQRQPNQAKNISHQPRASPNSTPLTSRIEFPTMTGVHNVERAVFSTLSPYLKYLGVVIHVENEIFRITDLDAKN